MKAIMYHYVREKDDRYPNFRYLDFADFKRQLDHFQTTYGFVSRAEWNAFIHTGKLGSAKGKVLLTFDDAPICSYSYAFPELKRRGLWGMFFASSLPHTQKRLLDVHRIHLLCGSFNGYALYSNAREILRATETPRDRNPNYKQSTYQTQKNHPGITEFKRLLNYEVPPDVRHYVLAELERSFAAQDVTVREYYASPAQLAEMASAGMLVGSHSVSHPVMSRLSKSQQSREINDSFKFIDALTGSKGRSYCHPYGGFHSFDNNTVELLNAATVEFSFNVEARDIEERDLKNSPHALPRYDCNEFPFGAAS